MNCSLYMIKKQTILSFAFCALILSSTFPSTISCSTADSQAGTASAIAQSVQKTKTAGECANSPSSNAAEKSSMPIRLGKNLVYGAAHSALATSSGLFCFCAVLMLANTGRGGSHAGLLNINLDDVFTFAAISGGIPSVYGLYRGLRGVYIAFEDSYCALTETDDRPGDCQAEEKKVARKPQVS